MGFDKAKVLKAAEKSLSQGKISAAIKEYRQIVDHDDEDLTTLNMLGDLYVRANRKEEAIVCFDRIAGHYAEQEFNLKAIAMYKKIEKLRPRDPVIARKLGDLYANQGLVVDARAQYLTVAEAFTRTNDHKKALEILHRIADLDPNNTEIRLKLADGYLKENMRHEAASAFIQAADRLQHIGFHDRALESYSKALLLIPDDIDGLQGILQTHIARGTADEAAEILEKATENREHDKALVAMLARAYLEAEDPKGAERATQLLISQDANSYLQGIPVAWLYLKVGQLEDAVRILSGLSEKMLAGREEKDLLELVHKVLEANPDQVGALRMLVRIHWWQRDMDALRSALERLAEAAESAELIDEERYALTQLVRLAPDEQRYLDRLNLIGGMQEEPAEEFPTKETASEIPEFETFAPPNIETIPAAAVTEFETNEADGGSGFVDPTSSFADLNEVADKPNVVTETMSFQEVDFGDAGEPVPAVAVEDSTDEAARVEKMMRQELESVDFYIAQGYTDIAVDTLQMLERQFGTHPEIVSRRHKLEGTTPEETEAPAVFEFASAEPVDESTEETFESEVTFGEVVEASFAIPQSPEPVATRPQNAGIDAGLAELFEEFRVAEEEETGTEDYETHYNMGTAYKEMDLIDEAIQEFQTSVSLVKSGDGTSRFLQCCNMLGHCFMQKGMPEAAVLWFKKGLAAPGHSEDEYQALRYELAAAYEQLGDLNNARQFYTEVYGVDVSYREVAEKLAELKRQK